MKLTARADYALRAVLELALRYKKNAPVPIGSIARQQNIPKNFLLQLLIRLKNAGIVESARGTDGGYFLACVPSAVTVADIFQAVDESVVDAARPKDSRKLSGFERCVQQMWFDISQEVRLRLESITIEDMMCRASKEPVVYHI